MGHIREVNGDSFFWCDPNVAHECRVSREGTQMQIKWWKIIRAMLIGLLLVGLALCAAQRREARGEEAYGFHQYVPLMQNGLGGSATGQITPTASNLPTCTPTSTPRISITVIPTLTTNPTADTPPTSTPTDVPSIDPTAIPPTIAPAGTKTVTPEITPIWP
ncbi:MAG: hypothetical protein M3Q44_03610 [bacterium]|nr:hypothetical protein [bacterium]